MALKTNTTAGLICGGPSGQKRGEAQGRNVDLQLESGVASDRCERFARRWDAANFRFGNFRFQIGIVLSDSCDLRQPKTESGLKVTVLGLRDSLLQ